MRSRHILFGCLVLAWLVRPLPAAAAEPVLVRDFLRGTEPYPGYADLYSARADDGVLYFVADEPTHGTELWRTDGTKEGTYRLTDICRGRCGSEPFHLEFFRGEIYFSADDGFSGRELWAVGTRPGSARRVSDLCPGPCSGRPVGLEAAGDRLFFEATIGAVRGLWTSDGTRRGTELLRAFCPGTNPLSGCLGGPLQFGNLVLFQAFDAELGSGVWQSDGTPEGTRLFSDLVPGFPDHVAFIPAGEGAAFLWSDRALWWTDGTAAGTRRIRTTAELGIRPLYPPTTWSNNIVWKGMLITVLGDGGIVRSDGTPAGTLRIGRLPRGSNLIDFAPLQDVLLIGLQGPDALWRTAGTRETTRKVTALPGSLLDVEPLDDERAALCLQVSSEPQILELWESDGTARGTRRTASGACGFHGVRIPAGLVTLDPQRRLVVTDGARISRLHNFGTVPASGGPLDQIGWNGQLLFSARTSATAAPLFLSDGTRAGTREISGEASGATGFAQAGGRVFFGRRGANGLWRTDGTAAGTVRVDPQISGYLFPMPVGDALFFSAAREYSYYNQPDRELFRSDGSAAGTGLVRNINDFQANTGLHHTCYNAPSDPGPGVALGGLLLFAADDGLAGRELWASDGTSPGTRLVADIDPRRLPGPPSDCDERTDAGVGSDPAGFVRLGDAVLFAATDEEGGRELWRTDGTAAGTRRVADLRPGSEGAEPHDLVVFQNRAWFIARADGEGEGLWRTDGTAEGTVLVRPLRSRGALSWARSLTAAGERLFFAVFSAAAGPELWTSQGTAASTRRVADIRPGPEGSYPQSLTAVGDLLVFAADDGVHGLEPWRSDGTAAGTARLGDINPGLDASAPGPFAPIAGGLALAGADDGSQGRELWAIPVNGDKK